MSKTDILNVARQYIGCNENDGTHKQIIDIYNSYTPLPRGYKVKYTDNWCAVYVSACAIMAGLANIIPIECSCGNMISLAKQMGIWNEDGNITPNVRDIILYDWDKKDGWPEHVGLVEAVSGNQITCLEGNKSNAVGRRVITIGSSSIRGYIQPRYDDASETVIPTTPTIETPVTNNTSSYPLGTYVITASDLIVRGTPAGSAVGHSKLTADGKNHDKDKDGALDKDTRVTVSEIQIVGNNVWGKIPSGWICLIYEGDVYAKLASTSESSNTSEAAKELGDYEVTASALIVRTGAGTDHSRKSKAQLTEDGQKHSNANGGLLKGTIVTVKEWEGNWARIPSGWVPGEYLKKV